MLFSDLPLARRLENTDALAAVEYARAWAKAHEYQGLFSLAVAGGHAGFAGVGSPLTQAFGLGLNGPVTGDDLQRLEEFFRNRGASVNIETCPLADPSLFALLNTRGYQPIEFSNVLVRELTVKDVRVPEAADSEVRVRIPEATEADDVTLTVTKSFFEGGEFTPELLDAFTGLFNAVGTSCFVAEVGGVMAGGAMVGIFDGVATLGGAGTLPEYRNRGVQRALIYARLAFAVENGCDLAMVATQPGSGSQRNVERQGFRIVYTRTKFFKQ
jgi:GNAT superfamily N-acetyltransferase